MVKEVTSEELDTLLKSGKKIFIDFHTLWCGPCKMVEPVINELSSTFEGQIEFVKVDIDEHPAIAAKYGVRSIPTFFVLENTSVLFKHQGAAPKSFFEDRLRIITR